MIRGPLPRLFPLVALAVAASLSACAGDPQYPIDSQQAAGAGPVPMTPAYPVRSAPGAYGAPGASVAAPAPPAPPPPPPADDDAPVDATRPYAPNAAGAVDQTPLAPPPATPPPAPAHTLRRLPGALTYVVAKSDTLYGVGRRFGLAPASVAQANGLDLDKTLQPGTRLKLPFTAKDGGEGAHASGVAERTPGRTLEVALPPPPRIVAPAADQTSRGPSSPIPYAQLVSGRRSRLRRGRTPADAAAAASGAVAPMRLATSEAPASAPPADLPVEPAAPDAQALTQAAHGRFIRPVAGAVLSSFGVKGPGQRNDGVDLAAHEGERVRAAAAGVVVYAGHDVPALGNLVAVKHADGWVTVYGNLETITVRPAERVAQGDQIGVAGLTSATPHPQVHFEVRYAANPSDKARPVDPDLVLPKAG